MTVTPTNTPTGFVGRPRPRPGQVCHSPIVFNVDLYMYVILIEHNTRESNDGWFFR